MSNTGSQPPQNWPDLLTHLKAIPRSHADNFLIFINQAKEMAPADPRLSAPMSGATDALARGVIMGQGPMMKTPIAVLQRRAIEVQEADDKIMNRLPILQLATLGSVALAEAAGFGLWSDIRDAVQQRLFKGRLTDPRTIGKSVWASLAWGHTKDAMILLQNGTDASETLAKSKVSAVQFSIANDGPKDAIDVYLRDFPALLAKNETSWCELLWAARAVHVEIESGQATDLPSWILSKVDG